MVNQTIVSSTNDTVRIDALTLSHRELNARLRDEVADGTRKIELRNVYGQRYIGTDLNVPVEIDISGVPGNDLGAFMNGPRIVVHGNAQDGCGNTMNDGHIIVHGHAGDITGMAARGGKIYIRDDVGYRAAIHMKEYRRKKPVLVIGGTAQDFFGEYMAGGIVILLGLNLKRGEYHKAKFIGTGMHGGVIYIGEGVDDYQLGKEVGDAELEEKDHQVLHKYVSEFAAHFDYDAEKILKRKYIKLFPLWIRPYGRLYAY
ncbi:MAG: hypothetical protein RI591_05885 [Dehalococcoidia bacterium]|nr:hypothetical protein [Dehalococcoidia bacterium]